MQTYRNDITYTTAGSDGTRYESTTVLDRPRRLTARGAERILRQYHPTAIVTRVSSCRYEVSR